MVTPTGYTALDLVGFTDKGPYSSLENYVKNDLSHHAGSIWRCKVDDTMGVTPGENANWTVFVSEPSNLVEAAIAPIETSPATSPHTPGSQLFYNDTLYKAKTAIAIGDTLTVGTNIEAAPNVTTQLAAKANSADLGTAAAKDSTSTIAQSSTDLIESGAVYSALEDKADVADLGTAAAKDSTNAVTQSDTDLVESGAVYTAVSAVASRVDTVEENIAPIENGATASQPYAIGEQFIKDDVLYKAKTAIAQGDTLTLNTNYEAADDIVSQMDDLNTEIDSVETNLTNYKAQAVLYFTSVACAATTGNFATVSNASITADHVVVECTFDNPSAITTDVTWTTASGSLTLNGTCASATSANITLAKKGN